MDHPFFCFIPDCLMVGGVAKPEAGEAMTKKSRYSESGYLVIVKPGSFAAKFRSAWYQPVPG